jgi:hypothetical protein
MAQASGWRGRLLASQNKGSASLACPSTPQTRSQAWPYNTVNEIHLLHVPRNPVESERVCATASPEAHQPCRRTDG